MKALNPSTGNLETVYVKALDSMPVGIIVEFPTTDSSQLPAGYMFCDGSEVSRTTYSKLFEVIGTKFGAGDGSTTFNLPSKEGLVTAGIKSSDTDFDTIGETIGNKTDNLSNVWAEIGYYENRILMNAQDGVINVNRDMACSSGTGISTQIGNHTKVSGSVSTLQPTIVSNFIIKVSETRALAGTILNAQNSSTTDTYSCDYQNKAFGGVVLWTNSSPSSVFAGQSVTLSSGDYNYLEIYFRTFTDQDKVKSIRFQKGQNGLIDCMFKFGANVYAGLRNFDYTDSTHLTFGNGERVIQDNAIATGTDNGWIIPVKIIGYK